MAAGVLVEIPIVMVLLSHVLHYQENRWANIVAGITMTAVQLGSLFARTPALYYLFFSVIEIASTAVIVWHAWNWQTAIGFRHDSGQELRQQLVEFFRSL